MRTINFLLCAMICIAQAIGLISCVSAKKVSPPVEATAGAVEVSLPFQGEAYRSSVTHFRAMQVGVSPDMATSRKIATMNARAALAGEVSSTLRSVMEVYSDQVQIGNAIEFNDRFQELTRQVIDQELNSSRVFDEKVFKRKDGLFECWVAVEMLTADVNNKLNNRILSDDRLRQNFNRERFIKVFEEELRKKR